MRSFTILVICAIFISSCKDSPEENRTEQAKKEIIQTEKEFSQMSEKEGMKKAFLYYAADDIIKLKNREHPIIGIDALRKAFEGDEDTSGVLSWYPVKADAAASGEIGYTFGNWEYTGKDSTGNPMKVYGNYFTVWKKDINGNWKFKLDGGNQTPPPQDQQERL